MRLCATIRSSDSLSNPTLAAQALTLGLAFALMVSGGMRIWWSIAFKAITK